MNMAPCAIRAFAACLVCVLSATFAQQLHAQSTTTADAFVLGTEVHLRTGPDSTFPSLGVVWIGTKVSVSERKAGWEKVRLTFLGQELEGWMREDVLSGSRPTKDFLLQQLTALPERDVEARQLMAERLIALSIVTGRGDSKGEQFEILAKILETKGQKQSAEKARKHEFQPFKSSQPSFEGKGFSLDTDTPVLAIPKITVRQAPADRAVPVPFSGRALELNVNEPFYVIKEVKSEIDGKEWAFVSTFRGYGGTAKFAGWVPTLVVLEGKRLSRVTSWTGPSVVFASQADWSETYYFDNDGLVYLNPDANERYKKRNFYNSTTFAAHSPSQA